MSGALKSWNTSMVSPGELSCEKHDHGIKADDSHKHSHSHSHEKKGSDMSSHDLDEGCSSHGSCSDVHTTEEEDENLMHNHLLRLSEQYYKHTKISGVDCLLQAQLYKGRVIGKVSLFRESTSFAFDFLPTLNDKFCDISLEKELRRLMFDLEIDRNAT